MHRSLLDWEWYSDTNCVRLALHFLLKANYQPKRWQGITIGRGQLVTSRGQLSEETGLSQMQIRTTMDKLDKCGFIAKSATSRYTIVTICNYASYQQVWDDSEDGCQTTDNQRITNEQPSHDQAITTTEEYKNTRRVITPVIPRRGKSDSPVFGDSDINHPVGKNEKVARKRKELDLSSVEPSFQPIVADWLSYKSERGQTYQQKGVAAFYEKLQELSGGSPDMAHRIVRQSMANNWAGIFALKNMNHERSTTNQPPEPGELARAVAEGIARANTRQEWEL